MYLCLVYVSDLFICVIQCTISLSCQCKNMQIYPNDNLLICVVLHTHADRSLDARSPACTNSMRSPGSRCPGTRYESQDVLWCSLPALPGLLPSVWFVWRRGNTHTQQKLASGSNVRTDTWNSRSHCNHNSMPRSHRRHTQKKGDSYVCTKLTMIYRNNTNSTISRGFTMHAVLVPFEWI